MIQPLGLNAGSMSTYTYVGGNPISRVDPLGLDYGSKDCSYYSQRCKEDGGMYYCTVAPLVCGKTPDSPWTRCVRKCLQDTDKLYCKPEPDKSCGKSDPKGSDLTCVVNIHQMCWEECAQNPSVIPPSAR